MKPRRIGSPIPLNRLKGIFSGWVNRFDREVNYFSHALLISCVSKFPRWLLTYGALLEKFMNDLKVSVTEIKFGELSATVIFECVDDSSGYHQLFEEVVACVPQVNKIDDTVKKAYEQLADQLSLISRVVREIVLNWKQ